MSRNSSAGSPPLPISAARLARSAKVINDLIARSEARRQSRRLECPLDCVAPLEMTKKEKDDELRINQPAAIPDPDRALFGRHQGGEHGVCLGHAGAWRGGGGASPGRCRRADP